MGKPVLLLIAVRICVLRVQVHLSFAPPAAALQHFDKALEAHDTTKDMLRVRYDQALPEELIRRMAEYSVKIVSERGRYPGHPHASIVPHASTAHLGQHFRLVRRIEMPPRGAVFSGCRGLCTTRRCTRCRRATTPACPSTSTPPLGPGPPREISARIRASVSPRQSPSAAIVVAGIDAAILKVVYSPEKGQGVMEWHINPAKHLRSGRYAPLPPRNCQSCPRCL